jgi:tetratricopeptide (TPR) repeat protein
MTPPPAPRPRLLDRWHIAAPALAAIASHATALGAGFVWLDHAHIEMGYAIAPPAGWAALLTGGFARTGFYRPLMSLSLSIDALAGSPFVFHATSLLWHAAAACLTAIAASALGLSRRAATVAGVLFAVHPVSALVAGAIAFRSEAMIAVALFGLIAAHVHRRPALAALAMLAGALTKETALLLGPLFIAALELTERPSRPLRKDPARVRLWLAEGAAFAVAAGLRLAYAPAWRAEAPVMTIGEAIGTRLASVSRAATTVLAPVDRTLCDAFAVTSWTSPRAIAGALIAAALLWLAWRRKGPAMLLALSVLPLLQIVPVMRWWSPHYLYIPLGFVAMLIAEAILGRLPARAIASPAPVAKTARKSRKRQAPAGATPPAPEPVAYRLWAAIAAAAVLGVVTLLEGRRYADDEALWRPEVDATPACKEGQFYLGEVARNRRAWAEAESRYAAAVAPTPGILAYADRAAALQNLGAVRLEQGDLDNARDAFRAALDVTPDPTERRRLVHNLANVALRAGDPAETSRLLEPEVARQDAFPESLYLAAKALHTLGRDDASRVLIRRLQRLGWPGSSGATGSVRPQPPAGHEEDVAP